MANTIYDTDKELKLHTSAIHSISQQYHYNEQSIKTLYEQELSKLKTKARITTYLSVLTTRHVKESLHQRNIQTNTSP